MAQNAVRIKRADGTWQDIAIQGPVGPAGPTGPAGPASTVPGPGVPVGGANGLILRKKSATNYDTEWAAGALVDFKTTGPRIGTGASLPAGTQFVDSVASARQIVYTTPAFLTRARISWQARYDATVAAWHFTMGGIAISPAPVVDYGPLYVGGGCTWGRCIFQNYLGGQQYFTAQGTFFADLAASTTYTIMHACYPGQSANIFDASMPIALINLEVFAR
jgi:hypothetical protein